MRDNRSIFVIIIVFLISLDTICCAKNLSPIDYGILDARNGIDCYNILMTVHQDAVKTNQKVTYAGLRKLILEVPDDPQSIPLSTYTDFAGVEIVVLNKKKNFFLFSMIGERRFVEIDKQWIDAGSFRSFPSLCGNRVVLVIEDLTPWVNKRKGYDVGANRSDILYLRRGHAINKTIQSYNNAESNPIVSYFYGSRKQSVIKNLRFVRDSTSTAITYLFYIECKDNVSLNNISIYTPYSELYGDQAITISKSTNIECKNILIDGTYSQPNKYGYGITMNNVWNSHFINLKSSCNWGVFGNYNVSCARIDNCDINRFDIHCYGMNIYCQNSVFRNLYNQFASFYGTLSFKKCSFINFVPILLEDSFSAYTPFEVAFNNCYFEVDSNRPYLVSAGNVTPDTTINRGELKDVFLPSIHVKKSRIKVPEDNQDLFIYYITGDNSIRLTEKSSVTFSDVSYRTYGNNVGFINMYYSNCSIDSIYSSDITVDKSTIGPVLIK